MAHHVVLLCQLALFLQEALYVTYNDTIKKPRENAEIVNQFLGGGLDVERMLAAIDQSLEPLAETTQIDRAVLHNVPHPTPLCNM